MVSVNYAKRQTYGTMRSINYPEIFVKSRDDFRWKLSCPTPRATTATRNQDIRNEKKQTLQTSILLEEVHMELLQRAHVLFHTGTKTGQAIMMFAILLTKATSGDDANTRRVQ